MSGASLAADFAVQRDGLRVEALLRVEPGEVVAMIGPSGAGKSTILAAVAGSVRLLEGEVTIGGRVVSGVRRHVPAARRGVVLLDQDARLFPHLSAAENVAFGPRAVGLGTAAARELAHAWLDRVGLAGLGDRAPARLSGGQQQRVALARALAIDPALVLLDEPFTSLDVETAACIRAVVQEQLAASGATAVVVTHAAEDAAALASRVIVIEAGGVAQEGALRAVLERPATRFAAAFADVNRVEGAVHRGVWSDGGTMRFDVADARAGSGGVVDGAAAAVFRAVDVRLERAAATLDSTARDSLDWSARVRSIRQLPAGVRVTAGPLEEAHGGARRESIDGLSTDGPSIAVDLDPMRAAALALSAGAAVRLRLSPGLVSLVPAVEWAGRGHVGPRPPQHSGNQTGYARGMDARGTG